MNAGRDVPAVWAIPPALQQLAECGDAELVEELLGIFQTDTLERLEVLKAALSAGNHPATRIEAHTIKGSALQVGANRMAALCQRMELEAQNGRADELQAILRNVLESFEEVCAAISVRKESTGTPFPG